MTPLVLLTLLAGVAPAGLKGVVNADKAKALPAPAREQLVKNGFTVVAGSERTFFSLYDRNAYEKVPSFISTDVVLHVFHVRFDEELTAVELSKAVPALRAFASAQLARALARWPDAGAPDARTRALALYHATALRLLDGESANTLDPRIAAEADADAKRLSAAQSSTGGAIKLLSCPQPIDATRFKPRGHYDRYQLRPYFRAFTFYSLCAFPLTGESLERARDVARLIDEPSRAQLDVLRALLTFVAGKSDSLSVELVLRPIATSAATGQTFRLLGGAAPPDTGLLEKTAGTPERPFPSALDVLASLDSKAARAALSPSPALDAALTPLVLGDSVYERWLAVLRTLLTPPAAQPPFAATDAWAQHLLVTAAGSWTELKHDTLLYVKQPLVMMQGGHPAELPASKVGGYVEPRPDVYRELLALRATLAAFAGTGASDSLSEFLTFCVEVSELELAGKPFPKATDERLRTIGGELERLSRTRGDESPPESLIADVFTLALPDGPSRVFHVATGDVDELWVVAPRAGAQVLMRGGAFSFYEFAAEPGKRLSDADWRELLFEKPPERPAWATPVARPRSRERR